MLDVEDKTSEQLAAEINGPQNEQVDATQEASQSPARAQAISDELILGKFKTQDDLIRSYQELERERTVSRQTSATHVTEQPAQPAQPVQFDQETVLGIKQVAAQMLEEQKVDAFLLKHGDELGSDPLLRGAVQLEIHEAKQRGEYIEHEVALSNARKTLDARLTARIEEATKQSLEKERTLSRRKEQAGAVGGTSQAAQDPDPDTLSAEEYAAYYNLDRSS